MLARAPAFTAAEICNIIKECNTARVAKFTLGPLVIEFAPVAWGDVPPEALNHHLVGETTGDEERSVGLMSQEQKEVHEDFRLAQLMTDDPVAYEQEMIDATLGGEHAAEKA